MTTTLVELQERSRWLHAHAQNVTSQHGEDGIILKALERLPQSDSWCAEFGAWDGKHLSNTYNLIKAKGFRAVLIEGNPDRFQELRATHPDRNNVIALNLMVGLGAGNGLDPILSKTPLPRHFDFLSIDIDGNDYHVWASLKDYQPKLVCIEFNWSIPNAVDFFQPADFRIRQGSSLRAIVRLGREKGYELIALTPENAIFVEAAGFKAFDIPDNSIDVMREDFSRVTHVFFGFDGTVFYRGWRKLPWHGLPLDEKRMQLLPRFLRESPYEYTALQRLLKRVWDFGTVKTMTPSSGLWLTGIGLPILATALMANPRNLPPGSHPGLKGLFLGLSIGLCSWGILISNRTANNKFFWFILTALLLCGEHLVIRYCLSGS